jgi:hypothetical protein
MKRMILVIFLSIVLILIANSLYAVGLGVHLAGGAIIHRGHNEEKYGDRMFLGAGFTLDSNVAMNNLFNYRMHIDYTSSARRAGKFNHDTINLQNSFGFGAVRLQNLRFWLGPHVHFFYDFTDSRTDVNIGLALGVNYNMSKIITLTLDCGARAAVLEWNSSSGKKYAARVEPFANVGILFRVKDEYSNEKIAPDPEKQEK